MKLFGDIGLANQHPPLPHTSARRRQAAYMTVLSALPLPKIGYAGSAASTRSYQDE